MKIIHLITTLDLGGAESQLLILAREQVKDGHEVSVLPLKGLNTLKGEFIAKDIEVNDLLLEKSFFRQCVDLMHYIKKQNPCVLHAHLARAQVLAATLRVEDTRVVLTRHDAMKFYNGKPNWFSRLVWKFVLKNSDELIAISESIRSKMVARKELKKSDNINIISYGISEDRIREIRENDREESRNELGVSRLIVFGTIGRFIVEKNQRILIEAFHKLTFHHDNVRLLLIGYGELESKLREQARNLDIQGKVLFLGENHKVARYINAFDIFVLPSSTEGFGLVLLEAMAAKLPIIGSNVDAIPEVLGNNCGVLTDCSESDSLYHAMKLGMQLKFRNNQAQLSDKRLQDFSSKKMHKAIIEVYKGSGKNIN